MFSVFEELFLPAGMGRFVLLGATYNSWAPTNHDITENTQRASQGERQIFRAVRISYPFGL